MHELIGGPRRTRLGLRLILGFAFLCATLVAIGFLSFFSLRSEERVHGAEKSPALKEIDILLRVAQDTRTQQAAVLRHLLVEDLGEKKEHERTILDLRSANTDKLNHYERLSQGQSDLPRYRQLLHYRAEHTKRTDRLLELSRAQARAEASAYALSDQVPAYNHYQQAIGAVLRRNEARERSAAADTTGRLERARNIGYFLVALAIAIAFGTGATVWQTVRRLKRDKRNLQNEISEHKRAKEAWRESESRFRILVDHSPDAIFVICDDRIVFANPATVRLLGATRVEQLIGRTVAQIVHPEEQAEVARRTQEIFAGKQPPSTKRRLLRLDGSVVEVESRVSSFRFDGKQARQIIARDQTERRIAAEKLEAQEKQYRLLFEDNPTPMWVYEAETGRILAVNQAAITSYGYAREEFLAGTLDLFHLPEDRSALAQSISVSGASINAAGEWRHLKKDGSIISVEIFSSPTIFEGKQARIALAIDQTERVESERKVRVSEANLALAQKVAGIGSWEYQLTPDDRVDEATLLCSAEAYRMFGHSGTAGRLSTESFYANVHPDDRQLLAERFLAFKEGRQPFDVDYRIIRPDGVERFIHSVADVLRDPVNGKRFKVVGTVFDITERKRAEEEIFQSRQRLRTVLDNIPQRVFWKDRASTYLGCNRAFALDAGFTDSEAAVGQTDFDAIWRDQAELYRADNRKVMETGEAKLNYEEPQQSLDGRALWLKTNKIPLRDADGKITGVLGTYEDITARKLAAARIAEQAELLNQARDAIIVRDLEGRILFWNKGAERLYGRTENEVLGQSAKELLYVGETSAFDHAISETITTGEFSGELDQITKDGRKVTVEAHWTLVRDEQGNPKSVLAINTDITEQKKIEEQFLRAQRLESIGTLASGVAHDLNNILQPIMMAAPVLRGEHPPAERERFLDIVEASAQRGAAVIKQVLTFARGADGDHVLLQPIYLLEEISKIAGQTFPKSITLRTTYDEQVRSLEGDPTQLHQVLLNLCINARDAMPNGGELCLSVQNFDLSETEAAKIPDATAGPHVVIEVTDSGTGIPENVIGKIFDPFFTTKIIGKGTGLGLSTVAGIVKSHGGFLRVSSRPGRTSFQVYLPAKDTIEMAVNLQSDDALPRGEGETILVVDDEETILEVAQLILEGRGYKLLLAEDGPTALGLFAKNLGQVSVVVTDLAMPVMDGLMLIRSLRRIDPQIKIIISTGRDEDFQSAEMAGLEIDGYLTKPFTTRQLLLKVREALQQRTRQAAA